MTDIPIEVIKEVDAYIGEHKDEYWIYGRVRCEKCDFQHNVIAPIEPAEIADAKNYSWECDLCHALDAYFIHEPILYVSAPRDIILLAYGIKREQSLQGMYGDGI